MAEKLDSRQVVTFEGDGVESALESSLEELAYHCGPPERSHLAFPIRPCFS